MRIWKYMDLPKFITMLSNRSLYFACPLSFSDPFEGFYPSSYAKMESSIHQYELDELLELKKQLEKFPEKNKVQLREMEASLIAYRENINSTFEKIRSRFGVNCWHINEQESEAMWKLYSASGQAVAIESTAENLKKSLAERDQLYIKKIEYLDFENDTIKNSFPFPDLTVKRKSFEHEKEIRAIIPLSRESIGEFVECDLNLLINKLHVSPYRSELPR